MIGQINKEYIQTRRWKLWARFMAYFFFEGRPVTTRGQWFNTLVFMGMAAWRTLPRLRKVDSPIYIIGTGRSGTTILGIVLSMHKKVGFLNEPKALWHKVMPHEDIIGSYSRSEQVHYRLTAAQAEPKMAKRLRRYYGAYAFWSFSRFVVDKYPELAFRVPFVQALAPQGKFIFLARNGWNTIHSIDRWSDKHGEQQDGEVHDWWGVDDRKWTLLVDQLAAEHPVLRNHLEALRAETDHRYRAAVEWVLTMQEGLKLKGQLGEDQLLFLPYEDLTEAVAPTMEKIREFCGLPMDATWVKYAEQVLRPNTPKEPVALPEYLQEEFMATMKSLGYTS